jgi:cell shape-determining protein MreC
MKYKYSLFIVVFLFVLLREPFLCLMTNINKFFTVSSNDLEINLLKSKNIYLEKEYEKLLDFKNNIDITYDYIITNTIINSYGFDKILINGNDYDINDEVVNENGLVGLISKVDGKYSEVTPIYDTKILVKINDIEGKILGKDDNNNLIVGDLSNYDDINVNDKVYSNKDSYIGKVVSVSKRDVNAVVIVEITTIQKNSYVAVIRRNT